MRANDLCLPAAAAAPGDSAEELADFFDQSPCGYATLELDGRVRRVNRTLLQWLGVEREAFTTVAQLRGLLTPRSQQDFDTATSWFAEKQLMNGLDLVLAGHESVPRVLRMTASTGHGADGLMSTVRLVFFDVSEMHRMRGEMAALNLQQAAMLDSELVGIVRLRRRRIVWKNRTLERMLGYDHDELLGRSTRVLYADDDTFYAVGREAYPVVSTGGRWRTQVRMRHKEGHCLWVDMNGLLLEADSDETLWVVLDVTALKQYQEQVEHIAFHDVLTGLPNRALLSDRLEQALRTAQRRKSHLAVCFLDLDGFKAVNDRFGHEAGDELLKTIAQRLRQNTRGADTVARLGGDEFVIVAPMDEPAAVEGLLDRIVAAVAVPVPLSGGAAAHVTASIGAALYPRHADTAEEMMRLADAALYEAKHAGKSRYAYATAPGAARSPAAGS